MNFLGVMDGDDHRGSGGSDFSKSMTGLSNEDISSDPNFHSMFRHKDMRLLALVSHNNMKQSMKQFVLANMNVLKKFRLTGTNTTMSMLREVFGKDPDVSYGLASLDLWEEMPSLLPWLLLGSSVAASSSSIPWILIPTVPILSAWFVRGMSTIS